MALGARLLRGGGRLGSCVWARRCWLGATLLWQGGGEGVLGPAFAEAGEEADDGDREALLFAAGVGDWEVEDAAAEGVGDCDRECAADQWSEAAEEEGVGAADVVVDVEAAGVDPLHNGDDGTDCAGDECGDP